MSFKMKSIVVGSIMVNCYILWDDITKDAVIIDPGDDAAEILKFVKSKGLIINHILNTHGHIDHISANIEVRDALGAKLSIHKSDASMLENSLTSGADFLLIPFTPHKADILLNDNDEIVSGSIRLKTIHTPGHTPGCVCFYSEENKILISGDTLFYRSYGRTDLPGGSDADLISSIKNKLFALPADIKVYPGHGESTTIAEEVRYNPIRADF